MFKKILFVIAVIAGTFIAPTSASAAECTLYEQSHPAFTLDGSHLSTGKCGTCATCHRSGVFIGTPRSCVTCHSGDPARITVSRSTQHLPTFTVECSSCHNTTSFTATWNMNHTSVDQYRCDSCHGGGYTTYGARKKTTEHIPTVADCRSCHTTSSWDSSHVKIHAGVTTGCVTCHNGSYAKGKMNYAPGHPVTSDNCETCHSTEASFKCATAYESAVNYASLLIEEIANTINKWLA